MTATASPQIHSFDGIHCAQNFDMANLSMVQVDGGYVAIDSGTSPTICRKIDNRWRELSGGEPLALILTHSHGDHNGGDSVYSDQDLPIWGHRAFLNKLEHMQLLPNAFFTRAPNNLDGDCPRINETRVASDRRFRLSPARGRQSLFPIDGSIKSTWKSSEVKNL